MRQEQVRVLADRAALQQAAAELIVQVAQARDAVAGNFTLVLAGGSTPAGLYRLLAQEPFRRQIAWERVWVVWGDERYVAPDDAESNYRLARETFLDSVPIPLGQVFPVPTHGADPSEAAQAYSHTVRRVLDTSGGLFDMVLLGLGPDGHTASLFPHHPALDLDDDQETLVVAVADAPKPPPWRISLTAHALNRARQVLFLVSGAEKADAVYEVVAGQPDPHQWPGQRVHPPEGSVTWLVDEAAARRLKG